MVLVDIHLILLCRASIANSETSLNLRIQLVLLKSNVPHKGIAYSWYIERSRLWLWYLHTSCYIIWR